MKKLGSAEHVPAYNALLNSTALAQSKKLQRLALRTDESRNKFNRRAFAALERSRKTETKAAHYNLEASAQLLRSYTSSAVELPPVAPLTFQKPTKRVVKSEAEKKRAVI